MPEAQVPEGLKVLETYVPEGLNVPEAQVPKECNVLEAQIPEGLKVPETQVLKDSRCHNHLIQVLENNTQLS